jgi:hypothetical protein
VTATGAEVRLAAIAAAEGTCPRCGAARTETDRYCLDCGLALPVVTGRLAVWRRRFIKSVGWYPGDWVWLTLPMLLVAIGGATAAISISDHRAGPHPVVTAATPGFALTPAAPVRTVATGTGRGNSSTLPVPPEPGAAAQKNGRLTWPAADSGWTIVLVSYPRTTGHDPALATATRAAKKGLPQVGVLDSSRFASLQPGYDVVFTGIYGSQQDADAAVATARQAGFGGAYSRQIAR